MQNSKYTYNPDDEVELVTVCLNKVRKQHIIHVRQGLTPDFAKKLLLKVACAMDDGEIVADNN